MKVKREKLLKFLATNNIPPRMAIGILILEENKFSKKPGLKEREKAIVSPPETRQKKRSPPCM